MPAAEHARLMELAVIGAAIENPVARGPGFLELPIEEFGGNRHTVAKVLAEMLAEQKPVSAQLLIEEIRTRGLLHADHGSTIYDASVVAYQSVSPERDLEALSRLYLGRAAFWVGSRLQDNVERMEVTEALAVAEAEITRLQRIDSGRMPLEMTYLGDLLQGEDVSIDWLIPHTLARSSSMMLTAGEGAGKSTVLRQLACAAVAGLDPFDPEFDGTPYPPRRVLLVDCEVSRNQLVRSLRHLWGYARKFAPEADPNLLAVESRQGGWDLSTGRDQAELLRMVREHRPDLIVVSPVYRMAESDLNTEEGVRAWQRPFENLMADGATFVTEHHAPNGSSDRIRDLRPVGSSAMRRWFGQGLSLRTMRCAGHKTAFCSYCIPKVAVEHWRGPRDETRWPHRLMGVQGQLWWVRDYSEEVE